MTCLRLVNKPEEEMSYPFSQKNHRLEVKKHKQSCECDKQDEASGHSHCDNNSEETESRYTFHLQHEQDIRENCWINFTTPWNINYQRPYKFAYCGRLQEDCFIDISRKHKAIMTSRLRIPEYVSFDTGVICINRIP